MRLRDETRSTRSTRSPSRHVASRICSGCVVAADSSTHCEAPMHTPEPQTSAGPKVHTRAHISTQNAENTPVRSSDLARGSHNGDLLLAVADDAEVLRGPDGDAFGVKRAELRREGGELRAKQRGHLAGCVARPHARNKAARPGALNATTPPTGSQQRPWRLRVCQELPRELRSAQARRTGAQRGWEQKSAVSRYVSSWSRT